MIRIPTVLVLGAGASQPYQFPLGSELVDLVGNEEALYASDPPEMKPEFDAVLRDWLPFQRAIRDAQPPSVDDFLEERQEHEKIGRLCIASTLMPCEHEAKTQMFGRDKLAATGIEGYGT